jgi:hypothetical protein
MWWGHLVVITDGQRPARVGRGRCPAHYFWCHNLFLIFIEVRDNGDIWLQGFCWNLAIGYGPGEKAECKGRRTLLVPERDQCNWSSEPDTWLEPHNHVQVGASLVSGHSLPFILCESIMYISCWGLDPVTYLWLFVVDPVPEKDGIVLKHM